MPYRRERCSECGDPHLVHTGTCDRCGAKLEPVFEGAPLNSQYKGTLGIEFGGGFGMFFDPLGGDVIPAVVLCKDCATSLVDANPWMKNFM